MALDLEQPRAFLTATRESFSAGIGGSVELHFDYTTADTDPSGRNPLEVLFESWHLKHEAAKWIEYAGQCNDSGWGFYANLVAIRMLRAYGFTKASDPAANDASHQVFAYCMDKIAGPNMLDAPAYAERLKAARAKGGPELSDDLESLEAEFTSDLNSILPKLKRLVDELVRAEEILGQDQSQLKWRLTELQKLIQRESAIDQHRQELAV